MEREVKAEYAEEFESWWNRLTAAEQDPNRRHW